MRPTDRPIPFPGPANRPGDQAEVATDGRLVAEVAAGHSGALAELYRLRGGALLAMLERMLNDEREAEEVLQDTFVRVWRRAADYDAAQSSAWTWMIMIARGLALDRLRRHSRRAVELDSIRAAFGSAESEDGLARVLAGESAGQVARALARLPLEQQQALDLAFWRGYTQEEIAEATGAPLGTVKARIRRGMLGLRALLKETHG